MLVGNVVIYLVGVPWLMAATGFDLATGLAKGVYPFLVGDLLKLALAEYVFPAAWSGGSRRRRPLDVSGRAAGFYGPGSAAWARGSRTLSSTSSAGLRPLLLRLGRRVPVADPLPLAVVISRSAHCPRPRPRDLRRPRPVVLSSDGHLRSDAPRPLCAAARRRAGPGRAGAGRMVGGARGGGSASSGRRRPRTGRWSRSRSAGRAGPDAGRDGGRRARGQPRSPGWIAGRGRKRPPRPRRSGGQG